MGGHGGARGEEDESLPCFEELLLDTGEAQESQRTSLQFGGDRGANTVIAASAPEATARLLRSKAGGTVPSVLHGLL